VFVTTIDFSCVRCVFVVAHTKTANDYFSANLTPRKIKKCSEMKGYISSILVLVLKMGVALKMVVYLLRLMLFDFVLIRMNGF
jgi:hypothetical protein